MPPPPLPPPPPPSLAGATSTSILNPLGASWSQGAAISSATQGILSGIESVSTRAWSIGANIAQNLISGFMSPWGRTGNAIGSLAGTAVSAGGQVLSSGLRIGGGILGAGAQAGIAAGLLPLNVAGGLFSTAGSAIGALGGAAGMGGMLVGGIGSLISSAVSGIQSVFKAILDGVTNLLSEVGNMMGAAGQLLGSVFSAALDIGQDVLEEAKSISRTIRQISFNTGVSESAGARAVNTFSFSGISPQALGNTLGTPQGAISLSVRAKALGLPDPVTNPEEFLLAGSRMRSQAARGGQMGALAFNALLGPQLGGFSGAFGLGEDRLRQGFAMSRAFQIPGGVGKLGGDIESAENIIGAFARNTKLVVAESLLALAPMITQAFSWLIQNRETVVNGIRTAANWLFIEMPKAVLHGGAAMIRGVGTVMGFLGNFLTTTFQDIAKAILRPLPTVLSGLDVFVQGFKNFGGTIIGIGTAIQQFIYDLINSPTVQKLLGAMGISPSGGQGATGQSGGAAQGSTSILPQQQVNFWSPIRAVVAGGLAGAKGFLQGAGAYIPDFWSKAGSGDFAGAAGDTLKGLGAGASQAWAGIKGGAAYGWGVPGTGTNYSAPGATPNGAPVPYSATAPMPPQGGPLFSNGGGSLNGIYPRAGRTLADAFQEGKAAWQGFWPDSNFAGQQAKITDFVNGVGQGGMKGGEWLKARQDDAYRIADQLEGLEQNWGKVDDHLAQIAENTAKAPEQIAALMMAGDRRAIARTAANIAEDYNAALGRI